MGDEVILERLRETASQMVERIGRAVGYTDFSEIMGVDTLNAVVLGFIFLAAVLVIASNIFYKKKEVKGESKSDCKSKVSAESDDDAHRTTATKTVPGPGAAAGKIVNEQPVEEVMFAAKVAESQQQSAPTLQSYRIPGVPLAKGTNNDSVRWIDNVLQWFYGPKGRNCFHNLEESWLTTLNAQAKKTSAESGVPLVFEKIDSGSNIPKLDNVYVTMDLAQMADDDSANPEDESPQAKHADMIVNADVAAANLSFGVQVSGRKGETTWSDRHTVTIDKLSGKLRITCLADELLFIVKFNGQPDMKLSLSSVNNKDGVQRSDKEKQALELVIVDTVSSAIASAIVDLTMNSSDGFPRFQRTLVTADPILPVGYDSLVSSAPSGKVNRKLLVKVMKATNLGDATGCQQPYCIVEMDNPAQKYQTSIANGTSNPFWDEHFLFDLNDKQSELLFEIYDKSKGPGANFLGHGIVNQSELLQAPSQRQIIPLQSRPFEHDKVSGSITVEFLFMEGAEIPDLSPSRFQTTLNGSKQVETRSRLTPGGTVITTTIKKTVNAGQHSEVQVSSKIELTPEKINTPTPDAAENELVCEMPDIMHALPSHTELSPGDNESDSDSSVMDDIPEVDEPADSQGSPITNGVESLTDAALRELETMGRSSPNTTTNKSTLIIHSVQREAVRPTVKLQLTKNGKWHEVSQDGDKNALSPTSEQDKSATLGSASSSSSKEGGEGRARSKDKKSLMGTLKRRLSFHKKRSKSMDTDGKRGGGQDDSSRSVSSDRSSARSSGHPFLGIPGGSTSQGQEDSTRSSVSDMSGFSSSSAQTYLHEASTLVIETNENGVVKHYLIPSSLSKKSKWKKRGTKLHIYNDHVFLAAHLPGSTACQVCSKVVPRRLGKQGYVCRDCQLTCHKHCHVKIDSHCPKSTVSTMEMEYIQDKKNKSKSS